MKNFRVCLQLVRDDRNGLRLCRLDYSRFALFKRAAVAALFLFPQ